MTVDESQVGDVVIDEVAESIESADKVAPDPEELKKVVKRMGDEHAVTLDQKISGMMGDNVFVKEIIKQSTQAIADAEEELNVKRMMKELGFKEEDPDPFGDGEQAQLFGAEAMKLQAQTSKAMDFDFEMNEKLSDWSRACYKGNILAVDQFISGAKACLLYTSPSPRD